MIPIRRRLRSIAIAIACAACSSDESSETTPGVDAGARTTPDAAADAATPSSRFANWAGYGANLEQTRAATDETILGPDNVADLERKWEWSGPAVTSTPIIYDGNVYFGDWDARVNALDALTGDELWSTQTQPVGGTMGLTQNQVNHSPFVTGDTIYAGAHNAELYAIDRRTGDKIWTEPLILDTQPSLMLWSSPALVGDRLVIGVGSYQVFIPVPEEPFRGNIVGVDVASGTVDWQTYLTDTSGVSVWSSPAVDVERGLAFVGTGQPYEQEPESPRADALVAFRIDDGEIAWHEQFTAMDVFQLPDKFGPDHDVGATPNLFEVDGQALVGVGDKGGGYHVLDRDSGGIFWTRQLTAGGPNGGVMASTAYNDGAIYVASNDAASGGDAGAGSGPQAGVIFALDARNGDTLWDADMVPGTFGAVGYANGVLYVPTLDGVLHALDASDGSELWSDQVGYSIAGGMSISGGMVFIGYGWEWLPLSTRGGLVAYGLPD